MLKLLSKHHDLWLQMLNNLGCEHHTSKDIVQDMYIRMHTLVKDESKIMYGNDVNRYYIWKTLKNLYFSKLSKDKKYGFYELYDTDDVEQCDYNTDEDSSFSFLMDKIDSITKDWTVYDKRLFELYFLRGMSLRKISKGTSIGLTSIHGSILGYKKILKDNLSEDLMDYFNEDYDKIL